MNENRALLQALTKNRHNDRQRLIYADWLEERGDPRADFLRLECELVQTWSYDDPRLSLQEQLTKLRQQLDPDWVGAVRRCTTPAGPIDVTEVIPSLKALAKTTVRLHPRPGIALKAASKLGGLFLWPVDERWPECAEHACPLVPVVQLRKQDVPELSFRDKANLCQVLWCPYDHEPNFCPAPMVFWRDASQIQETLDAPPPATGRENFGDWDRHIPKPCILYPERVLEYPDPFDTSPALDTEPLERALHLLMAKDMDPWNHADEIEDFFEIFLSIADGTKVGGYPHWVQYPEFPECSCGKPMDCIITFSSWEYDAASWGRWLPIQDRPMLGADVKEKRTVHHAPDWTFGDAGCLYLFMCRNCSEWPVGCGMQCS